MKKRILSAAICVVLCLSMATFAFAETTAVGYNEIPYTPVALEYETARTVTGTLDAENATLIDHVLRDRSEGDEFYAYGYAVDLKAGDTVTALALFADSYTDNSNADGYLYLLDGITGNKTEDIEDSDDDYVSTMESAITYTALADGTYYIIVTTFSKLDESDYSLTLTKYGDLSEKSVDESTIVPTALELGKEITGKLDLENSYLIDSRYLVNVYSVTLGAGETIKVTYESTWPGYVNIYSQYYEVYSDETYGENGDINTVVYFNNSDEPTEITLIVKPEEDLHQAAYTFKAEKISCKDGFIIDSDKTLLAYVGDSATPVVPNEVEEITDYAFESDTITSITIPASVKEIEEDAFCNCSNLTVINIDMDKAELSASGIDFMELDTSAVIKLKDGTELTAVSYSDMTFTELKLEYDAELTVKGSLDVANADIIDGSLRKYTYNNKYYAKGYSVNLKEGDTISLKAIYADSIETEKKEDYMYGYLAILSDLTGDIDMDLVDNNNGDQDYSTATLAYTAPKDGTYYIIVTTDDTGDTGDYSLIINKYSNLVQIDNGAKALELNKTVKDKLDVETSSLRSGCLYNEYSFTLNAGEYAYITVESEWPDYIEACGDHYNYSSAYTETGRGYYLIYHNSYAQPYEFRLEVSNSDYLDELEYSITSEIIKPENDFLITSNNTLVGYLGDETDIVIPDGIKAIAPGTFYGSNITSVTFPDTLETIGDYAFGYCHKLTEITLPESLKDIGYKAFYYCSSIETVKLSEGLENIDCYAFEECLSLVDINIPSTVKEIGTGAFLYCGIEKLTVPEGVASIGNWAFAGCFYLSELSLPSTITYIGDYAFADCYSLSSISINMPEVVWLSVDKDKTAFDYDYYRPDYVDPVYSIEADKNLNFDSVTVGYGAVEGKKVTVKNAGNMKLTGIKLTGNTNFTVTLSATELAPTETATLTIAPKTGLKAGTYTEKIKIETAEGAADTVEVTLTVAAKPTVPVTPDDGDNNTDVKEPTDVCKIFTDVKHGSWYEEYVSYVYDNGLMNGTSKTTFEPGTTLSRAMIVTIIARISGADIDSLKNTVTKFTDVPLGKWYSGAVAWAVETGVTTGTTDTTFSPDDDVTRQDTCVFLVRYAEKAGITLSSKIEKKAFPDDAKIGGWAKDAVYACQQAGIVNGTSEGTFDPRGNTTRNAAAKMIAVFYESYIAK